MLKAWCILPVLLVACAGSRSLPLELEPSRAFDETEARVLEPEELTEPVLVHPGERFEVRAREPVAIQRSYTIEDPSVVGSGVRFLGQTQVPPRPGAMGGSRTRRFLFEAADSGRARITFHRRYDAGGRERYLRFEVRVAK